MDVNEEKPEYEVYINRVGVEGISIPFYTLVGGVKVNSILWVDAYIDLPHYLRGIHASRSLEAVQETIYEYRDRLMRIEDISLNIAIDLLNRHSYSSESLVRAYGDIIIDSETPLRKRSSMERVRILGRGVSKKVDDRVVYRKFVGVRVAGLTACPSAKKSTSSMLNDINPLFSPTHMQRGYLTLLVEEPIDGYIDINELIRVARDSFSAPTYELLKREDEARVIIDAYTKPMFTEDVVRRATYLLINILGKDSDYEVYVSYKSLESIHNHNLRAVVRGRVRELAKYLDSY